MIYGPGGYKYKDFLVIGTPMQIVLWILSIILLSIMNESNWWVFWLIMFSLLLLIVGSRMFDFLSFLNGRMGEGNEKKESNSTRNEDEVLSA
jgi:hypothetical protein